MLKNKFCLNAESLRKSFFKTWRAASKLHVLYLRKWLIAQGLEEKFKYMTAMYYFKDKAFCYLTVSGKEKKLYLGFIKGHLMKHPKLEKEGRKQIKVFYLAPEKDLPVKILKEIVTTAKKLY